jgi:hypothetical protein
MDDDDKPKHKCDFPFFKTAMNSLSNARPVDICASVLVKYFVRVF